MNELIKAAEEMLFTHSIENTGVGATLRRIAAKKKLREILKKVKS